MDKNKLIKILIAICMFSVPASAVAAFQCNVDIHRVLIYANGAVNVLHSGRGDYTIICNLKTERQGVNITTCAMWASTLIRYEEQNKKATFYYNDSSDYSSCSELPTYGSSPAPVYVGNGD